MNNWIICQHFQNGSQIYTDEKSFDDIVDFKYSTDFGGNYILSVIRIDEYLKEAYPASFMIGQFDNDYIYYNGNTFYTKHFPMLVKMIHNRNINRELEALE